jgi:hypothetical protein
MAVSRRAPQILLAGCLGAIALAGCGSGSTPTTSTATTPASNGVAAMRAPDMLAAAANALRGVSSYRLQGTMTQLSAGSPRSRMSIAAYSHNAVSMVLAQGHVTIDLITDARKAYLRGSRRFWASSAHLDAKLAALFAGHWLVASAAQGRALLAVAGHFTPRYLANCLAQPVGGLAKGRTTTVDGQPAIILRELGNAPGGQPMNVAIATTGPAYPLRLTATGRQRPGGPKGPCYSSGPSSVGTITISDFGLLRAPRLPHAVTPRALEAKAASSSATPA